MSASEHQLLSSTAIAGDCAGAQRHLSPVALIARVLNGVIGKSILDVGCGAGGLVRMLVGAGVQVSAVDPSSEALAVARTLAPSADLEQPIKCDIFRRPDERRGQNGP